MGTYVKYVMRASRKVDDADLGCVVALVHPEPARGSGHHDAFPAAQVGRALQVPCLGMQVHRSMGITAAEQGYLRPDCRCPIGDVQHLGASLRCNGDVQGGPTVQLLSQVNDQPGLARTRRRGDHHCWIAGPGCEQRGSQGRVGVVRRRGNRRRERCPKWRRRREWCRRRNRALKGALRILGQRKRAQGLVLSRWMPRYSAAATTTSSGTSRRRGAGAEPPESQERRAA
jgi:hypothetical protein